MNFNEKNVIVTGANGFLGSWLVYELIKRKAKVIAPIRSVKEHGNINILGLQKKVKMIKTDLVNEKKVNLLFKKKNIDFVFHLAAQTIVGKANKKPLPTFNSNIKGTWNLMEACRKNNSVKGIIVASSDKAYGEHEKLPYIEKACLQPKYPYDVSKACADLIARSYYFTYGLPVAVTRSANIYGPADMNTSRIVPDTIISILKNKVPVIRSDGSPERDYIFVKDSVKAYLKLVGKINESKVKGQAFNIGNGKPIKVIELYKAICKACNKPGLKPRILSKGKLKGEIDRQYLDTKKIRRIINWKPETNLSKGLKQTVKWYKKNLHLF